MVFCERLLSLSIMLLRFIYLAAGACMLSSFSHVQLFGTLWTVAHQAPLSLRFSRQESWSRLPCPPPGDLSNPGIELVSPMSSALAGRFFTTRANWEVPCSRYQYFISVLCEIIFYHRDISFCLSIHQLMDIFFFAKCPVYSAIKAQKWEDTTESLHSCHFRATDGQRGSEEDGYSAQ